MRCCAAKLPVPSLSITAESGDVEHVHVVTRKSFPLSHVPVGEGGGEGDLDLRKAFSKRSGRNK